MAARYWVGGTANWDATAGTKWALTSGGAGGQAVPTSSDDVFFDATSGANTVTISATANAKSVTCTGFTGTFAGSSNLAVAGNVTLVAGMTQNWTGTLSITTTATLTSGGKSVTNLTLQGNVTFTLADDWNVLGTCLLDSSGGGGTKTVNGNNIYCYSYSATNASSRIMSGTTKIVVNAPVSGTVSSTAITNLDIEINAVGAIAVSSMLLGTGVLKTTTSNVTFSGTITISGSHTLDVGNVYLNSLTISSGATTITLNSGINITGTYSQDTGSAITNNGYQTLFKNVSNVVVGSFTLIGSGTHTMYQDFYCVNFTVGTGGNTPTLNGYTVYITGNYLITNTLNGITGTSTVCFNGTTGNFTISTANVYNGLNIIFNTSGAVTLGSNIYHQTGSLTRVSGTLTASTNTLFVKSSCTIDTAGFSWYNISCTTATQTLTLNSDLTITNNLTLSVSTTFTGTGNFSTYALLPNVAGITITFKSGNTYTVTNNFTTSNSTELSKVSFVSSTPSSSAFLKLNVGAIQDVMFNNATDIDSSGGQTIYTYKGTLLRTVNWSVLLTQPPTIGLTF